MSQLLKKIDLQLKYNKTAKSASADFIRIIYVVYKWMEIFRIFGRIIHNTGFVQNVGAD